MSIQHRSRSGTGGAAARYCSGAAIACIIVLYAENRRNSAEK